MNTKVARAIQQIEAASTALVPLPQADMEVTHGDMDVLDAEWHPVVTRPKRRPLVVNRTVTVYQPVNISVTNHKHVHYETRTENSNNVTRTDTRTVTKTFTDAGWGFARFAAFMFAIALGYAAFTGPTWGGAVFSGFLCLLFLGFAMEG